LGCEKMLWFLKVSNWLKSRIRDITVLFKIFPKG
jgi:hypothetical protein